MSTLRDRVVNAVVDKAIKGEPLFLEKRPIPGFISTQSLEVDALIGRPGIPLGRISEIKGWSGSGKSMLCCHLIAETQKRGGTAVLIDTERSYTSDWAESIGVDTSQVLDIVEGLEVESLESALRAIHVILDAVDEKDEEPVLIIVDSLSALATESELEADYDDQQPGIHARIMGKGMRKLTKGLFSKKVALVFVAQLREKIMSGGYGRPTSTIGGHAIFFHCALSLEMKRVAALKQGGEQVGLESRIKVMKNKLGGIPFTEGLVKFYYDRGFDNVMSALDVAVKIGFVVATKGWYQLADGGKKFRESEWLDIVTDELLEKIRSEVFPTIKGV